MSNTSQSSLEPTATPSPAPASVMLWGLRLLAYPLFFASGAAGLMYEVVWTRMLLSIFGAGIYAVSAVLTAFMAGLALGSWLLGRASDRLERPLRLYGFLELLIGCSGLLLPLLPSLIDKVDGWAYLAFERDFMVLTTLRFVCSFFMMLLPTTLMGATLPVLSRFMVRDREHLGLHVGALYAINTFGAVCGAFLAGFVLIGKLGLLQTEWAAVCLNVLVGLAALGLASRLEMARPKDTAVEATDDPTQVLKDDFPAEQPKDFRVNWIFMTAFASGMVSLAAQVIWSRSLIFQFDFLKNTTYSFSAMLTVFLAGLALGSALIGLLIDHQRNSLRLYGILLTMIGVSMMMSVITLHTDGSLFLISEPYNEKTFQLNWMLAVANIIAQTAGVLGLPTLLMGMAFPVAAHIVVKMGRVGQDVGRLYALNTLGAIFGSLLAGFVIVRYFGLSGGLTLLGAIDAALGLVTLALCLREGRFHLVLFGLISALMLCAVLFGLPERGLQPLTTALDKLKFYEEGPLATVAVVENNIQERTIYVDGVGVAGTDPVLQTDQKSLAHIGMMLVRNPKSALTVGFGSGGCSYSMLLHDRLQKVHCVEICDTVPHAAATLRAANHHFFTRTVKAREVKEGMRLAEDIPNKEGGLWKAAGTPFTYEEVRVLEGMPDMELSVGDPFEFSDQDPRYEIILDDARSYLRHTTERYDIIATDCTDLRYKSNANLYDREYFQACRDRLTEEGVVVVWMPLAGLSRDVFATALRTFHEVFPAMGVFFMDNEPTHYILLIGWQDNVWLDYQLFEKTLREQDVRDDLAELYLDDPVKLLSCFITGGQALSQFLGDGPLNTSNHPVIEFESPKYGYGDRPLVDNLDDLMAVRVSPATFLQEGSASPEVLKRLERYEKALPHVIAGHKAFRLLSLAEATREYMKAVEYTPEDLSLTRNALEFPILQQRIQSQPDNPLPYLWLAEVFMMQGGRKLDLAYDLSVQAEKILSLEVKNEPTAEVKKQLIQARQMRTSIRKQIESGR